MSQDVPVPISILKKAGLFCSLSDDELDFLADRVVSRQRKADEPIFFAGDSCEGLYLIESGTVKIFEASRSGREQVLSYEGAGSSLGELPILYGGKYSASAAAVTDAALLLVRTEDLRELCLRHPEVAVKLLEAVASRLRHVLGIVEQLCFSSVRQRLAALLVRLAEREGMRTARGTEFVLMDDNRKLAAQIGTVAELVSRNLGLLQAGGIIKRKGTSVIVPDFGRLEAAAKDSE
ncbi:MAG: Crp/Fnr family transcriptional regulator [Terriglobia bacterium]